MATFASESIKYIITLYPVPKAVWKIFKNFEIFPVSMGISVLDRRCRTLPEVVLVGHWVIEFRDLEGGGFGRRVGQGRSVYKQPETEVDGSCHS
jgi:hypothetical protein